MAAKEKVRRELSALTKDKLIDIIVNKKVPTGCNLSESVLKHIENAQIGGSSEIVSTIDENTNENTGGEVMETIREVKLNCDLKIARNELRGNRELIKELHRTIENQELAICLLKEKSGMKRESGTASVATVHSKSGKSEKNVEDTLKDLNNIVADSSDKKKITKKDNRHIKEQKLVWGSSEINSDNERNTETFAAATRRAWLYLGRVEEGVEADKIKKYLEQKFVGYNFQVEKLQGHKESRSASFKIGADFTLLDELNKPEIWPKGVLIKQFLFFRRKFKAANIAG